MKCTWPTPVFCVGTQRNLYSTDWRRGLASGKTQILALGNAKIYQHVGFSNAKFWRRGHCPTPTPDDRYFVSQWNIGLTIRTYVTHFLSVSFQVLGGSLFGCMVWHHQVMMSWHVDDVTGLGICGTLLIVMAGLGIVFTLLNNQKLIFSVSFDQTCVKTILREIL